MNKPDKEEEYLGWWQNHNEGGSRSLFLMTVRSREKDKIKCCDHIRGVICDTFGIANFEGTINPEQVFFRKGYTYCNLNAATNTTLYQGRRNKAGGYDGNYSVEYPNGTFVEGTFILQRHHPNRAVTAFIEDMLNNSWLSLRKGNQNLSSRILL